MKIVVEVNEWLEEDEVIIRCREINETTTRIQEAVQDISNMKMQFVFYKNNTEYYLSLDELLFFEMSDGYIEAHTANDVFIVRCKLYELEESLPKCFVRVSKSTILNVNHIISIDRNLTASSVVHFNKSHKQTYVSRHYYKALKHALDTRRR